MLAGKLYRGSKITAVTTGFSGGITGIARARVTRAHRGRISVHGEIGQPGLYSVLHRCDEGRMWARGWDTPEAMALSAEIALLVSK